MENAIKIRDLGVPPFQETTKWSSECLLPGGLNPRAKAGPFLISRAQVSNV